MKILIDFENGMQLALKPENLQLVDNGGQAALITCAENAVLPLLSFKASLATKEELEVRQAKIDAAALAAKAAVQPLPEIVPERPLPVVVFPPKNDGSDNNVA